MITLIRGGMICDGSGKALARGDILVEDGRIAALGPGLTVPAEATVIEAGGRTVAPGFVDIHRHCDAAVFTDPSFGELELAQGITTVVMGNCGMAPVPSDPRFRAEAHAYIEPVVGPILADLPMGDYPSYI